MHEGSDAAPPSSLTWDEVLAYKLDALWQQGQRPDVQAFLARAGDLKPEQLVRVLRVDQHHRWKIGQRVRAETYLRTFPSLRGDPASLDLVYAEFLIREAMSEAPALDEYLARFPEYAAPLRRQLELHEAIGPFEPEPVERDPTWDGSPHTPPVASTEPTPPTAADEEPPRPELPGYTILAELGRGGMGVVYLARHERLKRLVALKMLAAGAQAAPDQLARFRAEAEAVARLQHPNVVQIYEIGDYHGRPYIALEYVAGGNLAQYAAGQPQPPRWAARLVETLALAVETAHRHGVIHRDLKPANVLLQTTEYTEYTEKDKETKGEKRGRPEPGPGGTGRRAAPSFPPSSSVHSASSVVPLLPKITDFGLAKQRNALAESSAAGGERRTRTGAILGTPAYMAPEQASGRPGDTGPAVDIYALGAILYELLTGRPPFQAHSPLDTLLLVRVEEPLPPTRLQPGVPRDLETVCLKCLQKDPRRRYATAGELAADLARFSRGEPILARPVGAVERLGRWCRRRPLVAGLAGALLLVVCAAFLLVASLWQRAEGSLAQAATHAAAAERERENAEESLRQARQSVERYFTLVSEEELLHADGMQPLRQKLLEAARDYYASFLRQHRNDPTLREDLARAAFRVARITSQVGTKAEAAQAYEQARALFQELAADDPGDPRYVGNQATCYEHLGVVHTDLGRRSEALACFEAARALREQLLQAHPDAAKYRIGVAMAWNNIGLVQRALGRRDEALAAFTEAQCLLEAAAQTEAAGSVTALASTHHNVGLAHRDAAAWGPARQALDQSRRLLEGLVQAGPSATPPLQRSLGLTYLEMGVLEAQAGNPEGARTAYAAAQDIFTMLARGNPAVGLFRSDLAGCHNNLATLDAAQGQTARALQHLEQARTLQAALVAANPSVPEYRVELAMTCTNLAAVCRGCGRLGEAFCFVERGRNLLERLVRDHEDNLSYASELGHTWEQYGLALEQLGQREAGLTCLRAAVAVQRPVLERDPVVAVVRKRLSSHLRHVGVLLRDLGRHAEAASTAVERQRLWPGRPDALYDVAVELAACIPLVGDDATARQRYAGLALTALRQSQQAGFDDLVLLANDPALEPLWAQPAFRELLGPAPGR